MFINTSLLKLSLFVTCIFCSGSLTAAPVSWQLTFFDESGQSMGSGQFSYNLETITCIFNRGGNCANSHQCSH